MQSADGSERATAMVKEASVELYSVGEDSRRTVSIVSTSKDWESKLDPR